MKKIRIKKISTTPPPGYAPGCELDQIGFIFVDIWYSFRNAIKIFLIFFKAAVVCSADHCTRVDAVIKFMSNEAQSRHLLYFFFKKKLLWPPNVEQTIVDFLVVNSLIVKKFYRGVQAPCAESKKPPIWKKAPLTQNIKDSSNSSLNLIRKNL